MSKPDKKHETIEDLLSEEIPSYNPLPEPELKALVFFLEGDSRVDACLKSGIITEKVSQAARLKASRFFKGYRVREIIKRFSLQYCHRIGEVFEYEIRIVEKLQELAFSENSNPKVQLGAIRELRECLDKFSVFKGDDF